MIRLIFEFILGRILGYDYKCDRCKLLNLGMLEFLRNKRNGFHYCRWCWRWINLGRWKCDCGSSGTIRSQYDTLKTCPNCNRITKVVI